MGICVNYRFRRPVTQAVFDRVSARAQQVCAAAEASGLALDTTFTPEYLHINGVGEQSHEPFSLAVGHYHDYAMPVLEMVQRRISFFTKTQLKPYDAVVCAALLIVGAELRAEYGEDERGIRALELKHEADEEEEAVWVAQQALPLFQAASVRAPAEAAYWQEVAAMAVEPGKLFTQISCTDFGLADAFTRPLTPYLRWLLTELLRRVPDPTSAVHQVLLQRLLTDGRPEPNACATIRETLEAHFSDDDLLRPFD